MSTSTKNPYLAALEWHVGVGADEAVSDAPHDRTAAFRQILETPLTMTEDAPRKSAATTPSLFTPAAAPSDIMGTAQARVRAAEIARGCASLEELSAAIAAFDGLAIRKTATNMVFADGNPRAHIMLVGEAPGADEDRQGKPFVGVSGQLLDRILKSIGLDRTSDDPASSVYISNILNWRPPGNRTPSTAEIDISLPFIERHIALVRPKLLILCGGVSAKGLLGSGESISKLRGRFHDYKPSTENIAADTSHVPAIATYHPAYLLRTPSQKRLVWADMLMVRARLNGAE